MLIMGSRQADAFYQPRLMKNKKGSDLGSIGVTWHLITLLDVSDNFHLDTNLASCSPKADVVL